jgi:hypothetical protein
LGVTLSVDTFYPNGTGELADAMENFIQSPMNQSGITVQDMQTLMDRLRLSDGGIIQ